ncbi:MAG: VWA domain-containing protein [Myxococcales bacterium]|nr:VWA domain-containing protein [Myxococcales bacterium]
MRLRLNSEADDVRNHVAVLVAVDTSGSMLRRAVDGPSRLERAIEAITSIESLGKAVDSTEIGLIQFDSDVSLLMPLTRVDTKIDLKAPAAQLRNRSGGTRLELALRAIHNEFARKQVPIRKGIVLTDGETTDAEQCLALADQFARDGIALICIGIGSDYNEDFLAQLADRTNGFLYHLAEGTSGLEGLRQALWDSLLRAESEQATDVRLRLDLMAGVQVCGLQRVSPMVQDLGLANAGMWRLGNVGEADEVNLVAELEVPPRMPGQFRAGNVTVYYDMPAEKTGEQTCVQLIDLNYTSDAEQARDLNKSVVHFVKQARMMSLADHAIAAAKEGEVDQAQQHLAMAKRLSKQVGNRELAALLGGASEELGRNRGLARNTMKAIKIGAKTKTIVVPPTRH